MSIELEYRAMATTIVELLRLKSLFSKIHFPIVAPSTLIYDNLNALSLTKNHMLHFRIKHVKYNQHFLHVKVYQN